MKKVPPETRGPRGGRKPAPGGEDLSHTVRISLSPDREPRPRPRTAAPGDAGAPPPSLLRNYGREILDSLYDATLVATERGDILECNPRVSETLLYEGDELRGLHFEDLVSGDAEGLLREVRDHLAQDYFAFVQAECIRADGTTFPSEIVIRRVPVEPPLLCFFIRDVTQRRQVEDLLRTGYNAMQTAAAGIAIVNAAGTLEYVNPAMLRLWNYPHEEGLLGRALTSIVADEAEVLAMLRHVLDRREPWEGDLSARKRYGGEFPIHVSAACNRDADGNPVGAVLSIVDVTESRKAEDALKESVRQQAVLASLGAACHHLAQPATVILGSIHALQRMLPEDDPQYGELVHASAEAAEKLADLLHRLNNTNRYRTVSYLTDIPHPDSPDNFLLEI